MDHGIPVIWGFLLITIVVGTTGSLVFARLIRHSIEPLEAAIRALGEGVLRSKIKVIANDDIGSMAAYMNGALEQMTGTVSGIHYCSNKITDAATEILSRSTRAAETAITQRDRIRQISDSMLEMAQGVQRVSEDSGRASDSASNALEIARQGGLIVNSALVYMRTIAESVNAAAHKIEEPGRSSANLLQVPVRIVHQRLVLRSLRVGGGSYVKDDGNALILGHGLHLPGEKERRIGVVVHGVNNSSGLVHAVQGKESLNHSQHSEPHANQHYPCTQRQLRHASHLPDIFFT
jgi:uncharacterized protein YoxC